MEKQKAQEMVAGTGQMLLKEGLVARTWGNVSCRIDENTFAITPSGLDYVGMKADDIAIMDMTTGEWQGSRKPSGEKGVHLASYQTYADVGFVIHTHQTYATAIGLAGFENLQITSEEREKLGGIALAGYGLPGTKKLTNNVRKELESGAKVVLMAGHGVLICGTDREEAFAKAMLLEEICRRAVKGQPQAEDGTTARIDEKAVQMLKAVKSKFAYAAIANAAPILAVAAKEKGLKAQVDDMAQMIGAKAVSVKPEETAIINALTKSDAILVQGIGAIVKADTEDDVKALEILIEKAAVCKLHTAASGAKAELSFIDTRLMRMVYKMKYSKQK
jgi:L-ribulose-5-phosphate 4-epimerase